MSIKVHKHNTEKCWECEKGNCKGCMFVKQETPVNNMLYPYPIDISKPNWGIKHVELKEDKGMNIHKLNVIFLLVAFNALFTVPCIASLFVDKEMSNTLFMIGLSVFCVVLTVGVIVNFWKLED